MADGIAVEVRGLDELAANTLDLADKIGKSSADAFANVAEHVASIVASRQPVVSGDLQASVTVEPGDAGAIVGLGGDLPYAGWIEFGGVRAGGRNSSAERPYVPIGRTLYPASAAAEPELVATANKTATDEIRGYSWDNPA